MRQILHVKRRCSPHDIAQELMKPQGTIWPYEEWALCAAFKLVRRLISVPAGRDPTQLGVDENRSQLANRGILQAILQLVLSGHELVSITLKASMLRTLAAFAHSESISRYLWQQVFGDDFGVQPEPNQTTPNPGNAPANVLGTMSRVDPIISDLQQSFNDFHGTVAPT